MAQRKKSSVSKSTRTGAKFAKKGAGKKAAVRTGRPPNLLFKANVILVPTNNLSQKDQASLKAEIDAAVTKIAGGYEATVRKTSLVKDGDRRGKTGVVVKKGTAAGKKVGKRPTSAATKRAKKAAAATAEA